MTADNVLETWPRSRLDDYWTGWTSGYLEGMCRGREIADAEAAARHRAAADVVLAMVNVPEVDRAEAAARRARWDARFAAKGGA